MDIGCVKEIKKYEFRVGLTPDNVREYTAQGHRVYVEAGAGLGSAFADRDYQEAGATLLAEARAVWEKSAMLVKVKEPLESEYDLLQSGQILYTYLHLAANRPLTQALLDKKVKAVAYETVTDRQGGLPLLKPMSEVAGRLSIQEGAKCLEKPMGGMGILLGGVPGVRKADILIIGAGLVGANACRVAVGIGANVTIMDNNLARLAHLDEIYGVRIQTLHSTPSAIARAIQAADLVIGAVLVPGSATPKLIRREYLATMRRGSVIVDVAVDQGGCAQTTRATYHDQPTFEVDGVVHYCVANMPGAVAITSTLALTNATLPYGLALAKQGLEKAAQADPGLALGVNCYQGKVTYPGVAAALDLEYVDLKPLW
jgi:alanine dehydrogenase